ncbi:MAG: hypothetical protein AMXMBFR66_12460 [Pseudomonadota bacterium]|nr:MarR family transcriptional regulator [Rubrivivax sp.]NLZ42204.1 MarR family transcriptional regulator [Comamonadaceae bacterium]
MARAPTPARFYRAGHWFAEDSVGLLMKRLVVEMSARIEQRLAPHGLTDAQWRPLLRLRTGGPCTVLEMARWLQLDPSSTTRLLGRLDRKGLLRRTRSIADRRIVQLQLTDQGEAAIAAVPEVLAELMNELLAGFTRSEWRTLVDLLQRMLTNGALIRQGAMKGRR